MDRSKARALRAGAAVLALSALAGCGGGGGGGGTTPTGSGMSFPLQAGYKALIINGYNVTFDVSGDCTGSATQANQPAAAASFESVAGFKVVSTQSLSFSNCTPATSTGTVTEFFDAGYASLGSVVDAGDYGVNQTPATLPVSVRVGDSGSFGIENHYADSSKTPPALGRTVRTYAIAADTATTALGILTSATYDASNNLVFAEQDSYRIAADGSLSILSVDIQYPAPNALHLTLTPR
jgi:hypothetical protein